MPASNRRRQAVTAGDAFAVAAPGIAPFVAAELRALGLQPTAVDEAGVSFSSDAAGLYAANLHLRTASRVVIRVAQFRAAHFSDLEQQARGIAWERWVPRGATVAIRATSRKSRLYHSGGVAQRVFEAIAHRVTGVTRVEHADDDPAQTAQLVVVRVDRDECTVSVDSSGPLLHRRGYRQAVAKAPLRETLAAALLHAAQWDPEQPLVDPCCGSGTIPIEAALMARRIPPGRQRAFAFEQWPEFSASIWRRTKDQGEDGVLANAPSPIVGGDRDAGAIEAAIANAIRAGVAGDVEFVRRPLSRSPAPAAGPGLLLTNPPYGERIGDSSDLRDLYASLGKLTRGALAGWQLAFLASDPALARQTGVALAAGLRTSNGGIKVALYRSVRV